MCLRIIKHGDPVGNQRVVGLLYYISRFKQIVFHRISTSNVFFPFEVTAAATEHLFISANHDKT